MLEKEGKGKLIFTDSNIRTPTQLQNLYFLLDDKITSKDLLNTNDYYYIRNHYNEWYIGKFNGVSFDFINNDGNFDSNLFVCKKVIATTDTSLTLYINGYNMGKSLPQPSQQFIEKYIEEYNKGQQITECLVEYEDIYPEHFTYNPSENIITRLKVDKNNTITIKKLKDSYTREEVEILCRRAYREGQNYVVPDQCIISDKISIEEFIRQNL